jgi:hypothetical protein
MDGTDDARSMPFRVISHSEVVGRGAHRGRAGRPAVRHPGVFAHLEFFVVAVTARRTLPGHGDRAHADRNEDAGPKKP